MIVLEPRKVAEWCFLSEALMCYELGLLPLEPNRSDGFLSELRRSDHSYVVPLPFCDGWWQWDDEIARLAFNKMVPDPVDPPYYSSINALVGAVSESRDQYEVSLVHLEQSKLALLEALLTAKIDAKGRVWAATDEKMDAVHMQRVPLSLCPAEFEAIPPHFWRLSGVDFNRSLARGDCIDYFHILLNTEQLLEKVPFDKGLEHRGVRVNSRYLMVNDDESVPNQRGAPPKFDWPQLRDAAIKILCTYDYQVSQKTFVCDVQQWCERNGWDPVPSTSILRYRLKDVWQRASDTAFLFRKQSEIERDSK